MQISQRNGLITGKSPVLWLVILGIAISLVTFFSPVEKTLGAGARMIYLHGAWVWVALGCFLAAAAIGAVALITRRDKLHRWSRAVGRTGLTFWIAFFPLSLYLMQANWNGLYLDEPRWRVPFSFAITGLLLQIGLSVQKPSWSSAANVAFAIALFAGLNGMDYILHPVSPVLDSDSLSIKLFFGGLIAILALLAWQAARIWLILDRDQTGIM